MKKTLLIAAAALAAGVISSQAQVYSQNVVGYANVPNPTGNKNYFMTVPFKIGASNGINEVFTALPTGVTSYLLTWNGTGFDSYVYDDTDPLGLGSNVVWYNSDESAAITSFPTLPPGKGFVLIPGAPYTNTFAGTIAVTVGSSNVMNFPVANINYFVASPVPYAGSVTNGNDSGGGINLNNLPTGVTSYVLKWNGAAFDSYVYDDTDPLGLGSNVVWYNADESAPSAPPTLNVGECFVFVPGGVYNWKTGL
jgi:hypothetical protein